MSSEKLSKLYNLDWNYIKLNNNNVQKSGLPAPQSPDGLRPVCMESRFILCTNRKAVIDTSCVLSPNSSLFANLKIYRHGSATNI